MFWILQYFHLFSGAKLQGVDEVDNESVDKIKYTKSNKKAKDLELEARSQENSQSSNKLMNDANISPTKKESSLQANDDLDQSMDELDNDDDEDDDTSEPEEVDELREAEIVAAFDEFCIHVPSKSIAYQDQVIVALIKFLSHTSAREFCQ